MIQFVLNNSLIKTDENPAGTLLDFVRYKRALKGTKIGCREGDCGACTILMGEWDGEKMHYKSLTSCITPLGNAQGKHIVSIEGLNMENLSPFQQAMVDESGQQCGICTVGFIVSFAGECLSRNPVSYEAVISAIDGNICRCTGYKSIERAAKIVYDKLKEKDLNDPVAWLVKNKFIPPYFSDILVQLKSLQRNSKRGGGKIVGGGTDLLVQKPDQIAESAVSLISDQKELVGIVELAGNIEIKGATNTTELLQSPIMQMYFPNLWKQLKLVSSTPIRNIATIAGNFVNASPIGDLTAFFIALNSNIELQKESGESRIIKLKDFYKGYKELDKKEEEFISKIIFKVPGKEAYFNFEKVSKRKYLDIASVNTAMLARISAGRIIEIHISAGGIGPIPTFMKETCAYLENKELNESTVLAAMDVMKGEISPISDARGTKAYKSLLLRQLVYAHFMVLFPEHFKLAALQ